MSVIISRRADVHIRWMIRRDMPEVQAIENASFDSPWSEEEFIRSLRQRNCIGMVAEIGEKIVGYMIYELHRNRLEILNLAVHGEHRRSGVGSSMIAKLYGKLSPQRRTRIDAAVCERNEVAHYWLKACGFTAVEILRDHYEEIAADAYLFRLVYGDAA
jgi:ribosomal-protein-alanine N-acetyltransferase